MKRPVQVILPFLAIFAAVLGFRFGERREDGRVNATPLQRAGVESGTARKSAGRDPVESFSVRLGGIRGMRDVDLRTAALRDLFLEWIRVSPEDAFAAWAEIPEGPDATGLEEPVRALRSRLGFGPALALVLELGEPGLRESCLQVLASRIHELEDPESGVRSLLELPQGDLRKSLLPLSICSWNQRAGFDEIAGWIDANQAEFDLAEMAGLERAATVRLIGSHPEEAARWLLGRADENSLPGHLEHIASIWARSTPNAAAAWLAELPPGPGNDLALAAFSSIVVGDDPHSAALWAATIRDGKLRSEALSAALAAWAKLDPEAAAAFPTEAAE
jgi:hypothetical protein